MSRRIEVELTSRRDDGTWTWRAAGAKEPRGVVSEEILNAGGASAAVGAVMKVEADFELDGITILSLVHKREKAPPPPKIELLAPSRSGGEVTVTLAGRAGRGPSDRRPGTPRSGGPPGANSEGSRRRVDREAGPRSGPGRSPRPSGGPDREGRGARPAAGAPLSRRASARDSAGAGERPESRHRAPEGAGTGGQGSPAARVARLPAEPSSRRRPAGTRPEPGRVGESGSARRGAATRDRPRPYRFTPGTRHRDEVLAAVPPEQRPIADQLLAGGLPAVRRALEAEQEQARATGRPELPVATVLALAESLLPSLTGAIWLDRAEKALADLDQLPLRELRSAVAGSPPRGEEGRELAHQLREALTARLTKLREAWEADLERTLSEGRVLQGLRLSARPPEPSTRFPARLVGPLATAASKALDASVPPERWLALLEAAVASPVRRQIEPTGLPEDPTGAVSRAAHLAAGRIPALAKLLGMEMPPPPRPLTPLRPPRPPASARPARRALSTTPSDKGADHERVAETEQHTPGSPAGREAVVTEGAVNSVLAPSPGASSSRDSGADSSVDASVPGSAGLSPAGESSVENTVSEEPLREPSGEVEGRDIAEGDPPSL